jgi:glycosyltransferase involved in cell wall biosynthesis
VGSAGLFVDPDDVQGIAEAIGKVLDDPGLRQRLRAQGEKNLERFSWRHAAGKTLEVYERLLGESNGRESC